MAMDPWKYVPHEMLELLLVACDVFCKELHRLLHFLDLHLQPQLALLP